MQCLKCTLCNNIHDYIKHGDLTNIKNFLVQHGLKVDIAPECNNIYHYHHISPFSIAFGHSHGRQLIDILKLFLCYKGNSNLSDIDEFAMFKFISTNTCDIICEIILLTFDYKFYITIFRYVNDDLLSDILKYILFENNLNINVGEYFMFFNLFIDRYNKSDTIETFTEILNHKKSYLKLDYKPINESKIFGHLTRSSTEYSVQMLKILLDKYIILNRIVPKMHTFMNANGIHVDKIKMLVNHFSLNSDSEIYDDMIHIFNSTSDETFNIMLDLKYYSKDLPSTKNIKFKTYVSNYVKNDELTKKVSLLELQLYYHPGGECATRLKTHFETLAEKN